MLARWLFFFFFFILALLTVKLGVEYCCLDLCVCSSSSSSSSQFPSSIIFFVNLLCHPVPLYTLFPPLIMLNSPFSFSFPFSSPSSFIRQLIQQMDTQNHDQQPNRHNNQQRKPKPPQHHRTSSNSTLDRSISKILGNLRSCHRSRMLPQDAHQHEYRRDENQCERHLRHGSRGKGFDVNVGAGASVVFFVPAGKSGEEEEGEEGEDEGDDAVEK